MSFFLNYYWFSNENVFTIPKLHFFHATVPKLVLAPKGDNVPHPLPCNISRSTRPQVLLAKGVRPYLHLCSKATLGCFNQINGFIISFKLRVSRHFLPIWEICSFTFQSPFPNISTVTLPVALLKRKCSRLVWAPSFVMRTKPSRSRWDVVGISPPSPFY